MISEYSQSTDNKMPLATSENFRRSDSGVALIHQAAAPHTRKAANATMFASICERGVSVGLAGVVAGTALASGAVEPWSLALFEVMAVMVIILWAARCISNRRVSVDVPAAALPLALLVMLGLAQSVAFGDKEGKISALSLDVEATRSTVLAVFFLLVCFLAAANFLAGRKRARTVVRCLVTYGLVMAVFAMIQHLASGGRIYWLRPLSQGASWFGPFFNHAHYAGYMALLIPVPMALMMSKSVRGEERILFGFAAASMALSLIVSLSRGGMIALGAELLFLGIIGPGPLGGLVSRPDPARANEYSAGLRLKSFAVLAVMIACIGAGVVWLGPEPVADRIANGNAAAGAQGESFQANRGWIWRDSLRVFEAHPLSGVGMGAFETAFPLYSDSDGALLVSQSHNDYLQILADCGILGGVLAIWFVVAVGSAIFRGLRSRDPFQRSLSLGCGAAVFGMLVHSIFDFNLQLPSTALLFLIICAVASPAAARGPGPRRLGDNREATLGLGGVTG